MVIAYHLILTCYGFWLPNDPRGSWSDTVTALHLRPFGDATKTTARRSVAAAPHDAAARRAAKAALAHPPIRLTGGQARAVMRSFAQLTRMLGLHVYAAAVMPDHLHAVIARHRDRTIEALARALKAKATQRLHAEGLAPPRSPWARGHWSVFLRTADDVRRAIAYVNANPIKAGLPPQRWQFVTPYPAAPA